MNARQHEVIGGPGRVAVRGRPLYAFTREREPIDAKGSHEALVHPPLLISQQDSPKLGEPVGWGVTEGTEHGLAVEDGQPQDLRSERERLLELLGDFREPVFAKNTREFERVTVSDGSARELHLGMPAWWNVLGLELSRLWLQRPLHQAGIGATPGEAGGCRSIARLQGALCRARARARLTAGCAPS